jgi:CubicO group peptidase (beta-lactamase class C family)
MAPRFRRRRWLSWTLGAAIGLILLTLAAWAIIAGPVTVWRIVRYGDTDIDDFSHYPGRLLSPGDSPYEYARTDGELRIAPAALSDYGSGGELDRILRENDSIAVLIIRDDTILYERYFQGHGPSSLSQAFSMSKSVTSALIGMAIDDGYLRSPDQAITDLVPELAEKGFDQVTIHHLLTMMSGLSYVENDNPFGEHVILNYTPALEQRILSFELERAPGELYRYKSGDNALLALALDRALGGETITEYAQRRLWTPLGMQDKGVWTIDHEGDGLEKTWCCLAASARDLAKVGRLYLDDGLWNGQRILSPEWIERSTQAGVPEEAWPDQLRALGWWNYGYQWWLASRAEGDYFALGKDGQFLYLYPDKRLIIVRLGWSSGGLAGVEWVQLFQTIAQHVEQ